MSQPFNNDYNAIGNIKEAAACKFWISMGRNILTFIVIGALIILGLFFYAFGRPGSENQSAANVLDLSFVDYNGRGQTLSALKGQPVIIMSWASSCSSCGLELRALADIQSRYAGRLSVVAINRGESLTTAKNYTESLRLSRDLLLLLDQSDTAYQVIGGRVMPETVFIDGQGRVTEQRQGAMTFEQIDILVQRLLAP